MIILKANSAATDINDAIFILINFRLLSFQCRMILI